MRAMRTTMGGKDPTDLIWDPETSAFQNTREDSPRP